MASPPVIIAVATLSLLVLLQMAGRCAGHQEFIVGSGRYGWKTYPDEPQDHFKVNDTLVFFRTHIDPVLWVTPDKYAACNATRPLLRLRDGESRFVLNGPGYYYFISADAAFCRDDGERLIVRAVSRKNTDGINVPSPSAPSPSAGDNSSSSPAPSTNWSCPPSRSFAAAFRAGVVAAYLVVGAAIILA